MKLVLIEKTDNPLKMKLYKYSNKRLVATATLEVNSEETADVIKSQIEQFRAD